eukprot:7876570-Pyramimonas_sp.AAC.1
MLFGAAASASLISARGTPGQVPMAAQSLQELIALSLGTRGAVVHRLQRLCCSGGANPEGMK